MNTTMLAMLLVMFLTGCSGLSKKPESFGIPIQVKCAAKPVPVPSFALDTLPLDVADPVLFDSLIVERLQRIAYEIELIAAVRECQ